jgi:hypothetical protein
MKQATDGQDIFLMLKSWANQFGDEAALKKADLLRQCAFLPLKKTKLITDYHQTLIFILTHADNQEIESLAREELNRICDTVLELPKTKQEALSRSGIAFTETQGTFSLVIMKWLTEQFPDEVSIHSFDEAGIHPKELLKHCLQPLEFEMAGDETLNKLKWLQKASGLKKSNELLKWLVSEVSHLPLSTALKEQLFESLKLYIRIQSVHPQVSRTYGSIGISKTYYHTSGLLKKFDERALIHKKLPPAKKLTEAELRSVQSTARLALILLNREIDPVTHGHPEDICFYELEHGLSIALFSMTPEMRLPIESYIGFMMFKNGYPMSYGGAWLFGKRSLIGINIFEAFRGGESAFVFAQLLRTYKQAFGAEYFEVEPYQFGKNNPEGLRSGAFWFYHRFGFRPLNEELNGLAEEEHRKIIWQKGYRSSLETLKKFTAGNLGVQFGKGMEPLNPRHISHFITHQISTFFKGDRHSAYKYGEGLLKKHLRVTSKSLTSKDSEGFKKLVLFAALCLNLESMNAADKEMLLKLMILKGSDEFYYCRLFHHFPFQKCFKREILDFKIK